MQFYKIVHTDADLEDEYSKIRLRSYNVDKFLETHKGEINKVVNQVSVANLAKNVGKGIPYITSPIVDIKGLPNVSDMAEDIILREIGKICNKMLENAIDGSNNITIVTLEDAKKRFPKTNNLSIGTYTLHPYNESKLTLIEHYHRNLALEKDDELIVLLGKMGAKSLTIVENDENKEQANLNGDANNDIIKANVGIGGAHHLIRGKELKVIYEGNNVDIDSELLNDSLWYVNDSRLKAIFESRIFDKNKILHYTLRNTYTESFNFDFSAAAKWLTVDIDLKAEYLDLSKKERLFSVEFGT